MITEKLFYIDSYIKDFEAKVVSCQVIDGKNAVILDKTAFFPEGGGQKADTGFIGDVYVSDVQETSGEILHYVKEPLVEGETYNCKIDWNTRFIRMQEHTGEHIVSGIVHSMFGYDNVGFHMEDDYVTVDFSGELTREQLDEVEDKANYAVYANYPVKCYFPDESTLNDLDYRSKLDLTEGVRLVDIENTDLCACCAPHVNRTGEIGVIKILDFMRHRGGVRIFMKSGFDALKDYREKYRSVYDVSGLLSAKQGEIAAAVERVLADKDNIHREFVSFKQTVAENTKSNVIFTNNCAYCIVDGFDADMMRQLANFGAEKTELSLIFSGDDNNGYSYIACSLSLNMKTVAQNINNALNGRGGGRDTMIQGKVATTKEEIERFINNFIG